MGQKTVLVIGTGTIGEPLIGLLARLKGEIGIDRVIFHKRTPLDYEAAKVNSLIGQGAGLVVNEDQVKNFIDLGHKVTHTLEQSLEISDVVIDCTPAGNNNKDLLYQAYADNSNTIFIAQGSEKGFGFPYAWGINDVELNKVAPSFVQVVSCNTHAISRLILSLTSGDLTKMVAGDFVCIRRANDASQNEGFVPAPTAEKHSDTRFGTHHARDVNDLLHTKTGGSFPIFSSAMKINSQYMHMVRFSLLLSEKLTQEDIVERFRNDMFVTTTQHETTNKVFSFGRDHGFYGRIYNQAVVCLPSLSVTRSSGVTKVVGFAMTPQDGNSLLSSVSAAMYGLYGNDYLTKLEPIERYLIDDA
jgi:glyceraldehyde-3-phosphate dehydrogenase type II